MRPQYARHSRTGGSLIETLVSVSITAAAMSALYVGSVTLQKSFRAARQYAETQAAQMRVIDYVAGDLRTAISYPDAATVGSTEGLPPGATLVLQLIVPNYYD